MLNLLENAEELITVTAVGEGNIRSAAVFFSKEKNDRDEPTQNNLHLKTGFKEKTSLNIKKPLWILNSYSFTPARYALRVTEACLSAIKA